MKKLAQIVSLSVALCLCCCFSTFGSVKASAFDFFYNTVTTDFMQMRLEANVALNSGNVAPNDDYYYNFSNNSASGVRFFNTIFLATWDVMFDNVNYDYYVSLIVDSQSDDDFTFRPNRINVRRLNDDGSYNDYRMEDFHIYEYDGWNTGGSSNGYRVLAKFPDNFGYSIRGFSMLNDNLGSLPSDVNISVVIIQTNKDSSADTVNAIVQAINNQTNTLDGSIGQAADDIQQSIEDQYQIEEEEDFGFSDIQEQYEEKMGVLTFGTETTLQMLDLFSPSNAGEAYIRVPGWSMDIQGETYNVWNEYIFYFSWIEEWIPNLVRLMRTFNVTVFYLAILIYVNKVYERNFLAK